MGFGLAICKRIIEAHGGTITVKNAKNKGTTFIVSLPLEPKFEEEKIFIDMHERLQALTKQN
jgi:signal transduction histidine kinase